MDAVKIQKDKVKKCMDDSFNVPGDWTSYNNMLALDRELITDLGVQMNPSITINSHPYTGEMKGEKVFAEICKAYSIGKIPEVCMPDYDIQLALGHIEDFEPAPDGWFGSREFIFIVVLAMIFNIWLICHCMRKRKEENENQIQSQVQLQVEKYFKLQSDTAF